MDTLIEFDLISPEFWLASGQAMSVRVPSVEGNFMAMAGHAPVVCELRPGIVCIADGSSESEYFVSGGFAEVDGEKISILADKAVLIEEIEPSHIEEILDNAKADLENLTGAERDRGEKNIADLEVILDAVR